jgi:FtsP/CotA-like multicopper oxidase with cupredoxin domain
MQIQNRTIEYHLTASEFNWNISDSKTVKAWGFNQILPGPVLRGRVGDTLVIKVTNNLPQATLIHWHGLRIPSSMDGTDAVQKPIQPGESFEYRFVLPDAGTFWYHSHVNETVQMERGMYGALIVEDDNDPVTDGEKVFLLDDMKLDLKNQFTNPAWFGQRVVERHDGRQGETLLVNGRENPIISMHAGQRERWRFINAASSRYVHLYMGGKEFRIIGTDGGLLEHPRTVTKVLLTPGERVDIIAGPFQEEESFYIESLPYNRVTFLKPKHDVFATVKVGQNQPSIAVIPERLREIQQLAPQKAEVNRKIKFSVGPSLQNGMNFLVNGDMHSNDQPVRIGDMQVWEIRNTSLMDHPFHLHGYFFQVIEENGKTPEYKAWKDTYNLSPRSKIKIAWLPDNRPGRWMYHCHILEHHEAGMMAHFDVLKRGEEEKRVDVAHVH